MGPQKKTERYEYRQIDKSDRLRQRRDYESFHLADVLRKIEEKTNEIASSNQVIENTISNQITNLQNAVKEVTEMKQALNETRNKMMKIEKQNRTMSFF